VIPNGVDGAAFAAAAPWPHPRPYVLAVGRLVPQKGFDVLLAALARLDHDVDCLIAGDGPERDALVALRARLGLERRVEFLGTIGPDRLPALYRGATLVACPSRWEGLPLVCLEAMAAGRAVVASAVDGIPDAVVADTTGLLVPRDAPAALATALARLLAAPDVRARMGAAAATRAREEFAWPRVTAAYLDELAIARSG
jgi:glycosyltransferase involved in cell wall biosynthesis